MWFVYILLCEDSSLYTGISKDVQKRFLEHQRGKGGNYTRSRKVLKVVYFEQLPTHSQALKREIEIKSWSRKEKISRLNLDL
jgi:predicted GIY-YIG superfamily endonuclease